MREDVEQIPGIYNYCDSWCERCLFTKRCQSFAVQYPDGLKQPNMDAETLVKRLMETLELTKSYVDKARQQRLLPEHQAIEQETKALALTSDRLVTNSLPALCDDYLRQTAEWLKQEKDLLEQAGHQQVFETNLGLRTQEEAVVLLNSLKNAWEIIKWYRTLIPVKVISALQINRSPSHDANLRAYFNGKAKLVLVSVDQSLLAWHTLLENYPEKTDDVLDMLVLLGRIRRQMEESFPEARNFHRPGLD
ncbi:hypothetical protein GCM10028803_09630 [Larkinella knui]|uniref:Uncharacterized protein n=1 Tax=Larkinella knui TaxID=2025310 RepID=A0A3P1CCW9_9BACT|nr:hypothetical protein [Larkinella knui]RRB11060.1 hypothetical protein EHT87_28390 [Larkinella knui]